MEPTLTALIKAIILHWGGVAVLVIHFLYMNMHLAFFRLNVSYVYGTFLTNFQAVFLIHLFVYAGFYAGFYKIQISALANILSYIDTN